MTLDDLIESALKDPDSADFAALREAYAQSPEYDPYLEKGDLPAALQRLEALEDSGDERRIAEAADAVLALNPTCLAARMRAAIAWRELDEPARAEQYEHFVSGWLQALTATGDGASLDTALRAISLEEEAILMGLGGWKLLSRSFQEEDDHNYHVCSVRSAANGAVGTICFNIDAIVTGVREGRATMPAFATTPLPMSCEISRPVADGLRCELTCITPLTADLAKERIQDYLVQAGYRQTAADHFQRSTRWRTPYATSPRGWFANVTTVIKPQDDLTAVQAFFDVSTVGQTVIAPEVKYWQLEAEGLASALRTGDPDAAALVEGNRRAQRQGCMATLGNGTKQILVSVLAVALLIGLTWVAQPILSQWTDSTTAGVSNTVILWGIIILVIVAYVIYRQWRRRRG